jgi:two-component system chemotaxis response regulator CheY
MSLNFATMNVLIVDDQTTMLRIIRNMLQQIGFKNIHDTTSGETAIEMSQNTAFDLIISDWNMEPVSGLDFLKAVRASPKTQQTPFIMVTAENKIENIVIAKQAGVNNYIVKPFSQETLRGKIEQVCSK